MTYVEKGSEDEVFKYTVEEGCYLNNQNLVDAFVNGSRLEIPGLMDIGVKLEVREYPWGRGFNRPSKQYLSVTDKEPHGISIIEALRDTAEGLGVRILYNSFVTRLLTNGSSVVGATIMNLKSGRFQAFRSKAARAHLNSSRYGIFMRSTF